jgi:hypothetical protein
MSLLFSGSESQCHHKPQKRRGTLPVGGREGLTEVRICRPQSEKPVRKNFCLKDRAVVSRKLLFWRPRRRPAQRVNELAQKAAENSAVTVGWVLLLRDRKTASTRHRGPKQGLPGDGSKADCGAKVSGLAQLPALSCWEQPNRDILTSILLQAFLVDEAAGLRRIFWRRAALDRRPRRRSFVWCDRSRSPLHKMRLLDRIWANRIFRDGSTTDQDGNGTISVSAEGKLAKG